MERPPKKYVCEKCGYLAYHLAPFEQNYIDQLEKELADIKKLATSPASAPEGCSPTLTECPRCHNDITKCDGVFAAPTPPSTEDQEDKP